MKRIVLAIGLVLMLASCNQTKIAYVNIDEVLKEYEGAKNAEETIRENSDKLMAELEPIAREFQMKIQEFQTNQSKLSAIAKAEQEKQLMQEQQIIQQRQQMAQQQVQQESQQLYMDINKKIDSLIGVYAKTNGFSFVLGTSPQTKSVVYGDETLNITDEVIETLNESYISKEDKSSQAEESESQLVN